MPEALNLKGVSAGYGETHVLEEVNLALAEGESLSIIGRNGVGKSTLLETVMGNTTLHAGAISFRGRRIEALPAH
jgi:branched-chain amino acid transport system ATP-binding protein